jgi:orotidine-5'-phosphate decarboxylase
VHPIDFELIHQADRVRGHVRQRVARGDGVAQKLQERRRRSLQVGRAADVAVVKAHHVQAARRKLCAEVLLPGDHLRAEAHDQQRRRIGRVAEGLVAEGDPLAHIAELLRHSHRL